jgi:hypothetical protein
LDILIRKLLTAALRVSFKSRFQIAEELSKRVGTHISVFMLNEYTAPSKSLRRFPAAWVPAFCDITRDDSLRLLLLDSRLCKLLLELGERASAVANKGTGPKKIPRTGGAR